MIQKFIDRFNANYKVLENKYRQSHPESYKEIVKDVVSIIGDIEEYRTPSAERIVEIDHGDYQGNLLYVIGESGYQPSDYWYVMALALAVIRYNLSGIAMVIMTLLMKGKLRIT